MAVRSDIHRPTAIVAADYELVDELDLFDHGQIEAMAMAACHSEAATRGLREHIERMWSLKAEYRRRAVGDNRSLSQCSVCGAHIRYASVWEHIPTGGIITTGFDCAENINAVQASEHAERMGAVREWATRLTEWGKVAKARDAFLAASEDNRAAVAYLAGRRDRYEAARSGSDGSDTRLYDEFLFDILSKYRAHGDLSDRQVAAVLRSKDREAQRAAAAEARAALPPSQWIGKVGERSIVSGTVIFTKACEGYMGGSTLLVVVRTDDGNIVKTFAAGAFQGSFESFDRERGFQPYIGREKGEHVTFKGTVKEHAEYNGEKNTMMTRCKLISRVAPAEAA